ncbi:unnamed protein product [Calypogeia fissa]
MSRIVDDLLHGWLCLQLVVDLICTRRRGHNLKIQCQRDFNFLSDALCAVVAVVVVVVVVASGIGLVLGLGLWCCTTLAVLFLQNVRFFQVRAKE